MKISISKINLQIAFVALAILLPVRMLLKPSYYYSFGIHKIMAGFSFFALIAMLLYIATEVYELDQVKNEKWLKQWEDKIIKYLPTLKTMSKLVSGFSLLGMGAFYSLIFIFGNILNLTAPLSFKLIFPIALLSYLGILFVREKDVIDFIIKQITILSPKLQELLDKVIPLVEKLKCWLLEKKIFVGAGFLLLTVAYFSLSFHRSTQLANQMGIKLYSIENQFIDENLDLTIDRDFDQRLTVTVMNTDTQAHYALLKISETDNDELLMDFIGEGSNYEKPRPVRIPPGSSRDFRLMVHAADAQTDQYPVGIELMEAEVNKNDEEGLQQVTQTSVVDKRNITLKIRRQEIVINSTVIEEDPGNLRKKLEIVNAGNVVITDFSLKADKDLEGQIRINPGIQHYRFEPGEKLIVHVEPILFAGFEKLTGKLIGTGGGTSQAPLELPLSFNAPKGKKLFLAYSNCTGFSTCNINECVNRKRTEVPLDNPIGTKDLSYENQTDPEEDELLDLGDEPLEFEDFEEIPNLPNESNVTKNLRTDSIWLSEQLNSDNSIAPTYVTIQGNTHIAWHKKKPKKERYPRAFYQVQKRNGETLHARKKFSPNGEFGRWPYLAGGDNGEIFYVYEGNEIGKKPEIKISTSSDNGMSWGKLKNLTSHGKGAHMPRMIYKKEVLYVYWTDLQFDIPTLLLAISKDKGQTFSKPIKIASKVKSPCLAKLAIESENVLHFVYETAGEGDPSLFYKKFRKRNGSSLFKEIKKEKVSNGRQPDIYHDQNGALHFVYVEGYNNKSELYYRTQTIGDENWSNPQQITVDKGYSVSPTIFSSKGKLRVLYHGNSADPGKEIDHYYETVLNPKTLTWSEPMRLLSLIPNLEKAFLSVDFKLPWDRFIYPEHEVSLLLNGVRVAHWEKTIPEGKILIPINPNLLYRRLPGKDKNIIRLETNHFNPAHYLAVSEFAIITDLKYAEEYVFAENQAEADAYFTSLPDLNHVQADIGIYPVQDAKISNGPKEGDKIKVKVRVWNLGQITCTASTIDIFGGPENMESTNFNNKYLLGQKQLPPLPIMQDTVIEFSITYWDGMEKIYLRARTKEKDFDLSNNIHAISFVGPNGSPVMKGWPAKKMTGGRILRVALYEEPGELAEDIEVELYDTYSGQKVDNLDQDKQMNPAVWRLQSGTYDVHVKAGNPVNIEQWVRGIPIVTVETSYLDEFDEDLCLQVVESLNSFGGSISLDILLQQIENTLSGLGAKETDSGWEFEESSEIFFHPNEHQLNPYAYDYLEKVKTVLQSKPNHRLVIEGHTDDSGTHTYNQKLSEQRAMTVRDWLVQEAGIDAGRLTTVGHGETQPKDTENTPESRSKNRRVSFILMENIKG